MNRYIKRRIEKAQVEYFCVTARCPQCGTTEEVVCSYCPTEGSAYCERCEIWFGPKGTDGAKEEKEMATTDTFQITNEERAALLRKHGAGSTMSEVTDVETGTTVLEVRWDAGKSSYYHRNTSGELVVFAVKKL